MELKEYHWKSFDGLDLYAVQWNVVGKPDALIAFVHGHGDHCRRYDDWFSKMGAANISVISFDYRGNGRSQGRRGIIRNFSNLLQDVALLHEKAKIFYPGIPVVLYGHSLGATLVISYLLRFQTRPELAIATSPWLKLKKSPNKWLSLILKLFNSVTPYITVGTGLHSADFSNADGFAEKREKDEFVHNRISIRMFREVEKEAAWIGEHFSEIKTPLLLMQGKDDKVMKYDGARNLKEKAPGQVNYREWKFAGPQLHNSERSNEVMEYLLDWIKEGI